MYLLNGVQFKCEDITPGVPEGSLLGLCLYLLFIHEITNSISSRFRLYSDDCVLYGKVGSDNDAIALETDFSEIEKWCVERKVTLTVKKCVRRSFVGCSRRLAFT